MLVALSGSENAVKALLQAGADIDIKDKRGNSALSYAEKRGAKDIIALLRKAGW